MLENHVEMWCQGQLDRLSRTKTHTAGHMLVKTKRVMFLSASGGSDLNALVNKKAVSRLM